MKLRLMQITHDLAIGGLQQVVVNLCRFINRDKFDVSVLCLRELGSYTKEVENMGIKVTLLPQSEKGTDYFSFLKIAKILKREKIDIIHTHNTQPFVEGSVGALLSPSVKTIIHTDHARNFPDKKRYMFSEWLVSHFACWVVGVSDNTCQNLIEYEKISPQKVVTIPNGIDGSKFDIKIDKEKKKKELGLIGFDPIIGLGVRLAEQKGITYLLRAMPKVIEFFPNIALVIAGEGPLESDLKKEATALGIKKNVHFVGPRLDMPELLKLFDLYVLPSLWEGLPMVLLEAMAAGCPIIATDVGGNAYAIKDGYNGTLIEPCNPPKLVEAMINLLSQSNLKKIYILNGLQIYRDKFSAEAMTRRYEELYIRADKGLENDFHCQELM